MIEPLNESLQLGILRDFLGVLAILLTIIVYWISKRDSWLLWKMENVYDDIIDELHIISEEDTLPGELGERVDHSKVMELSSLSIGALGIGMAQEVRRYRHALQDLETAEQELLEVIPHLEREFPDVMCDTSETAFHVVVAGWTGEQLGVEQSGDGGPGITKLESKRPFELLFSGMDSDVFSVESVDKVRSYFEPEGEETGEIDLDEPVIMFQHDNLTHRGIAFWDENIPDWEERIYQLLDDGHIEAYLQAKKTEQDSNEALSESANKLLRDITAEVSESTDTSIPEIESVRP